MWVENHNYKNYHLNMKYNLDKNNFSYHNELHLFIVVRMNFIFLHAFIIEVIFPIMIKHEKFSI